MYWTWKINIITRCLHDWVGSIPKPPGSKSHTLPNPRARPSPALRKAQHRVLAGCSMGAGRLLNPPLCRIEARSGMLELLLYRKESTCCPNWCPNASSGIWGDSGGWRPGMGSVGFSRSHSFETPQGREGGGVGGLPPPWLRNLLVELHRFSARRWCLICDSAQLVDLFCF